MKRFQTALLVFVACFAAVFSALMLNRYFDGRQANGVVTPIYRTALNPIKYEPGQVPVDFRAAAKKVTPSVVTVDQFSNRRSMFGESSALVQSGTGSGVILSEDGIVVTNNHVVAGASEVKVRLSDHRTYTAKVLGTDQRSDIAVLKIEAQNLVPIELGNSDSIEVGEWVLAVGNPLGFENTVSVGVVSSLGRSLGVETSFMTDAIQTDAAINPGNSGGALTNANGQLIGINAAIASPSRGSIGIGFAIPINRVKQIVQDIRTVGYARYAGLGINYNPNDAGLLQIGQFRQQYASEFGHQPPSEGLMIRGVQQGGAAAAAGMQAYDILLAIDGRTLNDPLVLNEVLNRKKPGDTVSVKYWSKGETKTASVKLTEIRGS